MTSQRLSDAPLFTGPIAADEQIPAFRPGIANGRRPLTDLVGPPGPPGPQGIQGIQGPVGPAAPPLPFFESTNTITSVTTAPGVFNDHDNLSFTVPAEPLGRYVVWVYYTWSYDLTSDDFIARVVFDGTPILGDNDHIQEPQDSGGASNNGSGTNQVHVATRMFLLDIPSGNHSITLQHTHNDAGAAESTIHESRILVCRLGDV